MSENSLRIERGIKRIKRSGLSGEPFAAWGPIQNPLERSPSGEGFSTQPAEL
jgi:hypothetical protein